MLHPYMIGKDNWGTYNRTFRYATSIFAKRDPRIMSLNSGVMYDPIRSSFRLESFGQKISVSYPSGLITFDGSEWSPPFPWCLCIINYLTRSDGTPLSGHLISYRELEDGMVYYPAFHREAILKLSHWIKGKSPDRLARMAQDLGGKITEGADFSCQLMALPHFPITIKIWFPDDELDGSANILFDSTANHYLHTEDIAAIGEMTARFIMQHYQHLEQL